MKNTSERKVLHIDRVNPSPLWNYKQEDDGVLLLTLYKSGQALDCTGQTLTLGVKNAQGKLIEHIEGITINKSEINIVLNNSIFAVKGKLECDLTIKDSIGKMTTATFYLNVGQKILGEENVVSSNVIGAIEEIKKDYEEWKDSVLGGTGDGHTHSNKTSLDKITEIKINEWDSKSNVGHRHDASEIDNLPTGGGTVTNGSILDNYTGSTLNEKMVNMFADLNGAKKLLPMEITLPSGVIEVTQDLKAIGWKNKVFRCTGTIQFTNCNAIEFVQCQHNDIFIHRVGSVAPTNDNGSGLINPSQVASLTKRGIKFTDCSYNRITVNTIVGFTNGIEWYSEYGALGTFYNNFYFTDIWRCQRPMIFRTGKASDDTAVTQSGWITEIFVHGGKFDCDDGILIGQEVANRPANEPGDNYQGIKFYNLGVEHVRKQANGVGIYFLQGKGNAVINPRFEGSLLGGNPTSGAYILVKESIYAWTNKIETSNYPLNIDRVILNFSAKQANGTSDCPCNSYITGALYDNNGGRVGEKALAVPGNMYYEANTLSNYYFKEYTKPNTIKYSFTTTEFARVKRSDGKIFTIPYGTEIV